MSLTRVNLEFTDIYQTHWSDGGILSELLWSECLQSRMDTDKDDELHSADHGYGYTRGHLLTLNGVLHYYGAWMIHVK